jgi:histidinol-phosphate aminotransferase
MITVKSSVSGLREYHVPQQPVAIKLNQNESPWDVPPLVKATICRKLAKSDWNRYPQNGAPLLAKKLARYTGHSPDGILVGNGSNELIQTLVTAFCEKGDRILTVHPGFSVYGLVAATQNVQIKSVSLKQDFSFDLSSIKECSRTCRVTFITSPNNPTGTIMEEEEIAELAAASPSLIVVDEAYFEFSGQTALPLLSRFPNLIILRTFSKALCLAGFRFGYMLGQPDLIRELNKAKLPFSVGIAQQAAGETLLESNDILRKQAGFIAIERERVFQALDRLPGITPIPSKANFILFKTDCLSGKVLFQKLKDLGVLIRHFDTPTLKNMLRVTVGKQPENSTFLKHMESILQNRDRQ